jgi:hypothetical protein
MTKMVATTGIIYDGRIYAEGEEFECADKDVELLESNNHAAKPSSKEAKTAQKAVEEPEEDSKASKR